MVAVNTMLFGRPYTLTFSSGDQPAQNAEDPTIRPFQEQYKDKTDYRAAD